MPETFSILTALGYGLPAGLMVMSFVALKLLVKWMKDKQDKDRKEHMAKWDTMVQTQRESIEAQQESTTALIVAHKEEMHRLIDQNEIVSKRIIEAHREEINRMFLISERQASSIEALAHNLSTISQRIEQSAICPHGKDK